MAVHAYLKMWDQSKLMHKFNEVSFDRFLAIPHRRAVDEYGEPFATQHLNLCNTLRKALSRKLLSDRAELRTPPKTRTLEVDSLVSNIDRLSLQDGLGALKKSTARDRVGALRRYRPTNATENGTKRVSVKERLGTVYIVKGGRRRPVNSRCDNQDLRTKLLSARRRRDRADPKQDALHRESRVNALKKTYKNQKRGPHVHM